jgi:hypothetical protein
MSSLPCECVTAEVKHKETKAGGNKGGNKRYPFSAVAQTAKSASLLRRQSRLGSLRYVGRIGKALNGYSAEGA